MKRVYIYGDSLLKATVLGEDGRYYFRFPDVLQWYPEIGQSVVNRAMMGATVLKGKKLLERDMQQDMEGSIALVAYGGNDSDYDWRAIAENPEGEHKPRTPLPEFGQLIREMIAMLRQKGAVPVMMTLPPIDGSRYLDHICRKGLSRDAIMRWLVEEQMIYRHQELYSDTVTRLALAEGVPLIPVREKLLCEHNFRELLAADGIHMTMAGYHKMFDTLVNWPVNRE